MLIKAAATTTRAAALKMKIILTALHDVGARAGGCGVRGAAAVNGQVTFSFSAYFSDLFSIYAHIYVYIYVFFT